MKGIRDVEKIIKFYIKLLELYPELARAKKDYYAGVLDQWILFNNNLINVLDEEFRYWSKMNLEIFFNEDNHFLQIILKKISLLIIQHYLKLYSKYITMCRRNKKSLDIIRGRFTQFQIILH